MANSNNITAKVLSLIENQIDGDAVLLIDQHIPNALKTVCKMVADTKPIGHEKIILTQYLSINPTSEDNPFAFGGIWTALTTPIINTGELVELRLVTTNAFVIQVIDNFSLVSGLYYRGTEKIHGQYAYYLSGHSEIEANPLDNAIYFDGSFWNITSNGHVYFTNDEANENFLTDGSFVPINDGSDNYLTRTISAFNINQNHYGRPVKSREGLRLSESHGQIYYLVADDYLYINYPRQLLGSISNANVTQYAYLTITQFPDALEDLLVSELVRLIQNEPNKQQLEKQNDVQSTQLR